MRDNLRVKQVPVGDGDTAKRFVVCHNPDEADRDRVKRDETIARLTAELDRIAAARARTAELKQQSRREREEAAHTKAECALRDHRSLGPVFHRLEHRIRAHVLLCWLALLLIRVAERQSGQTWRRIALELQRLHQVTLTGPDGTVEQTTPPTPLAAQILAATKVKAPPQITAISPA